MTRDLTDDEKQLWKTVTRTAKPIPHPAADKAKAEEGAPKPTIKKEKISSRSPIPHPLSTDTHTLNPGDYANIDRATAEKFRKGEYPIDARLDLHGMTRDQARSALGTFLAAQHGRGSRCLLVITGKGLHKTANDPERGILREMLPQWLDSSELRPLVLAFDAAKPHHGGAGAYYVLLKRKR